MGLAARLPQALASKLTQGCLLPTYAAGAEGAVGGLEEGVLRA